MAETMKAAVVHEYGKPLVIEEVPVPEVRPGRILVKVEACSRPTRSTTSTGSLSINGIFERMKAGHIDGRIVMEIA